MLRIFLSLIFIFVISINDLFSCTTAVVSGKYTEDGRPILWKHRDSDFNNNKLMYFTDGKYDYIGLINSEDIKISVIPSSIICLEFSLFINSSHSQVKSVSLFFAGWIVATFYSLSLFAFFRGSVGSGYTMILC